MLGGLVGFIPYSQTHDLRRLSDPSPVPLYVYPPPVATFEHFIVFGPRGAPGIGFGKDKVEGVVNHEIHPHTHTHTPHLDT